MNAPITQTFRCTIVQVKKKEEQVHNQLTASEKFILRTENSQLYLTKKLVYYNYLYNKKKASKDHQLV